MMELAHKVQQEDDSAEVFPLMTGTYSPEDNKLRIYASERLDKPLYLRLVAAGFKHAYKQGCFVAPKWTPERADLMFKLCGEIGDEDKSLVDRAEDRADRFSDYRESRTKDAKRACDAVHAITDHIPLGQPILVGHHSERRARKDAERIDNSMRKAVKMWDTADYWKRRATAALRHAKYKERADVRYRRIKTLEADARKFEKTIKEAEKFLKLWKTDGLTQEQMRELAGCDHVRVPDADGYETIWFALDREKITPDKAREIAIAAHTRTIEWARRWIEHTGNRITYEKAMLGETGGIAAEKTTPEKGGACVSWVKRGAWLYIQKVNRVSVSVLDNWGNGGQDFTRTVPFGDIGELMTADQVKQARIDGRLVELPCGTGFVLRKSLPPAATPVALAEAAPAEAVEDQTAILKTAEPMTIKADISAMREQLKSGGVRVVTAPQLFPTPAELAQQMVLLAGIAAGDRVLEPEAGTARILRAIAAAIDLRTIQTVAVEINQALAAALSASFPGVDVRHADFLQCPDLGKFDKILMNPPFANGQDIAHIKHAMTLLSPRGSITAICANGPRQKEILGPIVSASGGTWQELPQDAFKTSGTGVSTALIKIFA